MLSLAECSSKAQYKAFGVATSEYALHRGTSTLLLTCPEPYADRSVSGNTTQYISSPRLRGAPIAVQFAGWLDGLPHLSSSTHKHPSSPFSATDSCACCSIFDLHWEMHPHVYSRRITSSYSPAIACQAAASSCACNGHHSAVKPFSWLPFQSNRLQCQPRKRLI